jgi:hypothetical protein
MIGNDGGKNGSTCLLEGRETFGCLSRQNSVVVIFFCCVIRGDESPNPRRK